MVQFPLNEFEMEQLSYISDKINKNHNILQLTDDEKTRCFDLLQLLIQRDIIKDLVIDNTNAYLIVGSFDEFMNWVNKNNQISQKSSGVSVANTSFELLSTNCEELLSEIIEHRNSNGSCDLGYWKKRFDDLNYTDSSLIRSQFGILKERKMISVSWGDNSPYILSVLENGVSYFEMKNRTAQVEHESDSNKQDNMKYDVFISHANDDKLDYVNSLAESIGLLGINIFYDSDVISWGDNWKQTILEGTAKSRFAIIVISNSFFGREWTERELKELLDRQNESGQKIVLPLLYSISIDDMKEKYPFLSEIQVLETKNMTNDKITILFAKELIKRLKQETC